MKILVVRFSSIGDIMLTTPVIRGLKVQLDAEVHYATKKGYETLLNSNPYLSRIYLLDRSLIALTKELKKENYDVIVDLHNNLRTSILKVMLAKKTYTFHKLNLRKWIMVNFKINLLPNVHVVDRYMKVVAPLGVKKDPLGLDHFMPVEDNVEDNDLPETHQKEFVAVVVGAKYKTKQLPVNRLIELCDRINRPVVLIGGVKDQDIGEEIASFFQHGSVAEEKEIEVLNKKTIIYNACGKFSLNQSAAIIAKARWVFTHDTGMMHIAAAYKKKIFSIWGNTVPSFGMYPYHTSFVILENNKPRCRPCSKIGFARCPKKHFKCMNDLVFDFYLPE